MPSPASPQKRSPAPASWSLSPLLASTAIALVVLGAGPAVFARQEPPAAESPSEAAPSESPPPSEPGATEGGGAAQVPPELQSPYLVRVYKVRPAKLFKGLLEALAAEGYPPEEVDEAQRTVVTSFVDFKQDNYELQVAEAPPRLGGRYHILQLLKVKAGKVSLQGIVTRGKEGTELKVRARILVMGLDRVKRLRVLTDRRSTGVIESEFIHHLEARSGLQHE